MTRTEYSDPMSTPSNPSAPERRRGHRLLFLIIVWALVILGNVALNQSEDLERNIRSWLQGGFMILGVLLTLVWFFFLSRFRWTTRVLGLLVVIGVVFGLRKAVRVDGTADGTGRPKWVWAWSPARTNSVARPATPPVPNRPPALESVLKALPAVPQFFGPSRDGVVRGTRLDPDWTNRAPRLLWRQPIGSGWSSFSSVNGRLFTQEQNGADELVSCYDLLTGARIWSARKPVRFFEWQGGEGPRATPTVVDGRVYTHGGTGVLLCVDAETGREIWSRSTLTENDLPNLIWGVSDSPLVLGNAVVVAGGAANHSTLLAYDRETGKPLWKAGSDKASYASPSVGTIAGKTVILSVNAASFTLHDPADGKVLLEYPWANDKWPKCSQPVLVGGDRVFLSAGYGVGCLLLQIQSAADGRMSATEVWKSKTMKTQFNSAALKDGFLYGLDDGFLACVDASTGQRKWKDGRYGSGQTLVVDDLVVIQNEQGTVHLAQAKPDGFIEFGWIPALDSKTWNHPLVVGNHLVVRNDREAACYELPLLPVHD